MELNLSGKNALVCGSTQGIGKAIALEFARAGARVTLVARNKELLESVLCELDTANGQKHSYICVDFLEPDSLKLELKKFLVTSPPVHILVNNTGGPKPGEIIKAETDEFEKAFRQHLVCNHILVQALVDGMKKEKYGRVINIISTSVKQPIRNLGVSNAIRAAVANWAKTLSVELAPYGITVNNILPGATKTERLYSLLKTNAEASGKTFEEVQENWLSEIPLGRFAEPQELAYAALFLASPLADYINGINLPVDGGRLNTL